jgi:hypothetical protein
MGGNGDVDQANRFLSVYPARTVREACPIVCCRTLLSSDIAMTEIAGPSGGEGGHHDNSKSG